MAENDFTVTFEQDDFMVVFGEQGPQGPAAAATPFNINDVYEQGDIVFDTSGNLFGSKINDNTGNLLSDTDAWTPLGIAAGAVTQLNDLTDVTIASPTKDQILAFNNVDNMWENTANHGGNTPVNPTQDKLTITFNPTSIVLASEGSTSVTATPGINSGFTITDVSWVIKDQNNHEITPVVDPVTFVASFNADDTLRGHISASMVVTYTRDSDSSIGTDNKTALLPVRENWFTVLSATQPSSIPAIPVGVWSSPKSVSFTQNNTGRNLYIILPTDDAPYTFTGGIVTYDNTNLGVISTDYTMFRIDDYDDSQTSGSPFPITITEV